MIRAIDLFGATRSETRALDQLDDRRLADIGLERQGDVITDATGRPVRRLAQDVGFERALRETFSSVYGGYRGSTFPATGRVPRGRSLHNDGGLLALIPRVQLWPPPLSIDASENHPPSRRATGKNQDEGGHPGGPKHRR
jgi:hypothetical protein